MRLAGVALLLFTLAARAADPPGFAALQKKAEAAREANHTEDAIGLYERALHLQPKWTEGWWYLGTLRYDSDQFAGAVEPFRHVTALEPTMGVAWAMLGLSEFETKDYDRALAHLQRSDQIGIAQDQGFFEAAQYHLALLLTRSQQFEAAIEIISKFAASAKDGPKFIEAMGIAALRKPVLPTELPPTEREMVMDAGRAMCDAAARRTADAAAELETMLKKYPDAPQLHYLYGMILLVSDADKAMTALKEEIAISPSHAQALVSLAGEYLKRSDFKTALPYAEKAALSNPGYFAAHAMLGRVLVDGDLDVPRGTRELELASRMAPANPQTRFALAGAYVKAGRKDDAAKERAEFLRLRERKQGAVPEPK